MIIVAMQTPVKKIALACATVWLFLMIGSASAQEIHLKKTILRVDPAECARNIGAIARANRRHTQAVALDCDCGLESRHSHCAVELRQARLHSKIKPTAGCGGEDQQHADHAREQTEAFRKGGGHELRVRTPVGSARQFLPANA